MVWCKRIATSLNVEEDGGLICTFYSPTDTSWDSQYLYSIRLMRLHGDEFNLNGGRFKTFRFQHQKYRVLIVADSILWMWGREAIIDWIAENIDCTWSMKGVARNTVSTDLEFSFADSVAAVHFALRWR